MSAVIAVPELMAQAATDLATIGDTLNAAHMTAAVPTVAVLPAAADEVSTSVAHLFSGYGQEYQKLAGEAAASYEQFAQHVTASAGAYASAEAANAALLQPFTVSPATTEILGVLGADLFNQLVLVLAALFVGFVFAAWLVIGLLATFALLLNFAAFPFSVFLNYVLLPALNL